MSTEQIAPPDRFAAMSVDGELSRHITLASAGAAADFVTSSLCYCTTGGRRAGELLMGDAELLTELRPDQLAYVTAYMRPSLNQVICAMPSVSGTARTGPLDLGKKKLFLLDLAKYPRRHPELDVDCSDEFELVRGSKRPALTYDELTDTFSAVCPS